jgi:hypothetical protein
MPRPIFSPRLIIAGVHGVTDEVHSSVLECLTPLLQPPRLPHLVYVLALLRSSVRLFIQTLERPRPALLAKVEPLFSEQISDLAAMATGKPLGELTGLDQEYPEWVALVRIAATEPSTDQLVLIGAEYCLSLAQYRLMQSVLLELACPNAATSDTEPEQAGRIARRLMALLREADEVLSQRETNEAELTRADDERIRFYLRGAVSFSERKVLKAVALGTALRSSEIKTATAQLRANVERGDLPSLVGALSYWVGPPPTLARGMRISGDESHTVRLLVPDGLSAVDLSDALRKLAAPIHAGCKPSRLVLVRPLPLFLHAALVDAIGVNYDWTALRQVLGQQTFRAHDTIPGVEDSQARRLTFANLHAARSRMLIDMNADLHVAAYTTLDLRLVPTSAYPYALVSAEEIWSLSLSWSRAIGWGDIVPFVAGPGIGSRVTPTDDTMTNALNWVGQQVLDAPIGNHSNLDTLKSFHHVYALAVAAFASFLLALREVKVIPVLSTIHPARLLRDVPDKVSTTKACPPSVCCGLFAELVRLWLAHCRAFLRRLLNVPEENRPTWVKNAIAYLNRVLAGEAVPLLFTIDGDNIVPVGTGDWWNWLREHHDVKEDWSRHWWPDALRHVAVSSNDIQAFLRHIVEGRELLVSTSGIALEDWRLRVVVAKDKLLRRLGIRVPVGLARRA